MLPNENEGSLVVYAKNGNANNQAMLPPARILNGYVMIEENVNGQQDRGDHFPPDPLNLNREYRLLNHIDEENAVEFFDPNELLIIINQEANEIHEAFQIGYRIREIHEEPEFHDNQ